MRLAQQRFLSGKRLPAAVAILKDVGEADAGDNLAFLIKNLIQPTYEGRVTVDMSMHFSEAIAPGLALWDSGKRLSARVERAVDIGVFEFIGQNARNSIRILVGERFGPVVFQFEERGVSFGLIFGAICREQ
jgi:hypothetical protein